MASGYSKFRCPAVFARMALHAPMALEALGVDPATVFAERSLRRNPPLPPLSPEARMLEQIFSGREDRALTYLMDITSPAATDEIGLTLLHHAAQAGMLDLSERLIARGSSPRATALTGESVLSYAICCNADYNARNRLPDIVRLLLRCGADARQPDLSESWLPEQHAARHGDLATLNALRPFLTGFEHRTLREATRQGHAGVVRYLLQAGTDPLDSAGRPSLRQDIEGSARLLGPQAHRAIDIQQMLLRAEVVAEVYRLRRQGFSAKNLLELPSGAEVGLKQVALSAQEGGDMTKLGGTTRCLGELTGYQDPLPDSLPGQLFTCAAKDNLEAVAFVLAQGAVADERGGDGRTPLFHAVASNALRTAKYLLERGADPNAQDVLGFTPLMLAASAGAFLCVRLLLSARADPRLTNYAGLTARELLVRAMGEAGSDPQAQERQTQREDMITLLMFAEQAGRVSTAPPPPLLQ